MAANLQIPNLKQPRRCQIYLGYKCNQRCTFCYYRNRLTDDWFSYDLIKKQILTAFKYGIRDFEITGGEPGIYDNLMSVILFIKSISPTSKVAVITNGSLHNHPCIDIWNVLDEVLLSVHAVDDLSLLGVKTNRDNAYNTVNMSLVYKKLLRTNTIVGNINIEQFDTIVDYLKEINPRIINFLPLNIWNDAICMVDEINYDVTREKIKAAIEKLKTPKNLICVRFMPFCDMQNYETHMLGNLQHIYDWFDWNPELLELHNMESSRSFLTKLGPYGNTSYQAVSNIQKKYCKDIKCLACKYNSICDGVEHKSLLRYTKPTGGTTINNPMYYIGKTIENTYSSVYGTTEYGAIDNSKLEYEISKLKNDSLWY